MACTVLTVQHHFDFNPIFFFLQLSKNSFKVFSFNFILTARKIIAESINILYLPSISALQNMLKRNSLEKDQCAWASSYSKPWKSHIFLWKFSTGNNLLQTYVAENCKMSTSFSDQRWKNFGDLNTLCLCILIIKEQNNMPLYMNMVSISLIREEVLFQTGTSFLQSDTVSLFNMPYMTLR